MHNHPAADAQHDELTPERRRKLARDRWHEQITHDQAWQDMVSLEMLEQDARRRQDALASRRRAGVPTSRRRESRGRPVRRRGSRRRSSATRAGPSSDDSSGEPEPPGIARAASHTGGRA